MKLARRWRTFCGRQERIAWRKTWQEWAHDFSRCANLLRSMNSYYANRIEGQHTRPREIDQALRKDFSKDTKLAARQRLAVAHIESEVALEQRYAGADGAHALYDPDAVLALHQELFSRLPAGHLSTDENAPVVPDQLRQREVQVGQHVAPAFASVPAFLQRWGG